MSRLVSIITATDPAARNQSLDAFCRQARLPELQAECAALDAFRRTSDNLYERVRALFFLYAIYRFHYRATGPTLIPFAGYTHLLNRRFEEAIDEFLALPPSDGIASALATAYHQLGFQTLANQVRRSVRSVRGNQWMFRIGHPADQPLRIHPELLRTGPDQTYPILRECTPVRMDLSHSGWSDIFFLGMDYPEGARVLNISIDLGVHGRDAQPRPPVEAYLRVIDQPVIRLTSVDLGQTVDIQHLDDIFDFARDYLGLLKAAIIAAGLVPPGIEGSGESLAELLSRTVGPGLGLEIVSSVNAIPKGSRLAVSTNLLAALIAVCMRATGQARNLTGQLSEDERRLVAARAVLGEWLGGSGGGWQDSGGVWPGAKLIQGVPAQDGDPEAGISRGRLLPNHTALPIGARLQDSLVLVHGGMAQNVGPILEMVTEKYLLRSEVEWTARQDAKAILDEIIAALAKVPSLQVVARTSAFQFKGERKDMRAIGQALGARYLIDGSVRKAGTRVRITAQLVQADNGVGVWTDSYDRELTDVFAIQDEITAAIRDAIGQLKLTTKVSGRRTEMEIGGKTAGDEIRRAAVNEQVSHFAAIPEIRSVLLHYQRGQVDVAKSHGFRGLVMEGCNHYTRLSRCIAGT